MRDINSLKRALEYISSDDYQTWITVIAALKNEVIEGQLDETDAYELALDFSATSSKFDAEELYKKWLSFENKPSNLATPGVIFELARENGYEKSSTTACTTSISAMKIGQEINIDEKENTVAEDKLDTLQSRANHLITFLRAMYKQDDYIRIQTEVDYNSDRKKWTPTGKGKYTYTVGEIIAKINENLKQKKPTLLGLELGQLSKDGSYNHKAGGWCSINSLDGKGVDNGNVSQYKYALLESDEISKEEQLKYIHALNLPYKALIDSGNKSIHCILLINAKTYKEYGDRVRFIYDFCEKAGFAVDRADKNPSRMYRLPGLIRGDVVQRWIELKKDSQIQTFDGWQSSLIIGNPVEMSSAIENFDAARDLAPELIHGILRKGHKMLISGSSKCGKTATLIELALALACGKKWLGFDCEKSRVVYYNMEVDAGSFTNRVVSVVNELKLDKNEYANYFYTFNLRGITLPLPKFIDLIIPRLKSLKADVVIIDPIYKLMSGDENTSKDVGAFVGQFDRLAAAAGVSVIYSHHYTKGSAYNNSLKAIADRAAGSGVFGRDADAIVTMTQLHYEPLPDRPFVTAWKVESVLREFAPMPETNVFYDYPVHRLDTEHLLDDAKFAGDAMTRGGERRGEQLSAEKDESAERVYKYLRYHLCTHTGSVDTTLAGKSALRTKTVQNDCKISQSTLSRYINDSQEFMFVKDGRIGYVVRADTSTSE